MAEDTNATVNSLAERAVLLASRMEGTPPILLIADDQGRETVDACPLSGKAARTAILSMTFLNPLVLNAANVIEGSIP